MIWLSLQVIDIYYKFMHIKPYNKILQTLRDLHNLGGSDKLGDARPKIPKVYVRPTMSGGGRVSSITLISF